jgi:hypothetical protein
MNQSSCNCSGAMKTEVVMRIYNIYNVSTFPLNCLQAWAMEANRGVAASSSNSHVIVKIPFSI